jgi:MFS family permease
MVSQSLPWGLRWRSKRSFILATVTFGLFTDLLLYGLMVPVFPFMLTDRLSIPEAQIQTYVSSLLTIYASTAVIFSIPAGWIADQINSRQSPFLVGLAALAVSTAMLAFSQSIRALIIARILQGISGAVVWTVGIAMVLDTVGPQNLGMAMGSVSTQSVAFTWPLQLISRQILSIISLGELFSPALGGLLYDWGGIVAVFGLAVGALALDFIMRLLVIDERTAKAYESSLPTEYSNATFHNHSPGPGESGSHEEDPLLPRDGDEDYRVRGTPSTIVQSLPILYCFRNPRLVMGFLLSFIQASLIAVFNATIPTEAKSQYNFSSLHAGLLFIALNVPYFLLSTPAGLAVDRYGTKLVAVVGFGFLSACLVLLRLPSENLLDLQANIILYCVILALNGIGLATISSVSFVEIGDVVQKYDAANPGFFGDNGPYAQLYGFNNAFFFSGLAFGPIFGGTLRDAMGYGNLNAVLGAVSAAAAIASFYVIGGRVNRLS